VAHTWIPPSVVAKEALRQLENNLVMGRLVHRAYEGEYQKSPNGWKQGATITIKAPVYFRPQSGATINVVDLREEDITIVVDQRYHVAWPVTSQEMTLDIDKFSQRFITPAMQSLSNYIDKSLLQCYRDIPNQVGTPGSTPQSFLTYALAAACLDDHAVPTDGRNCVINPTAQAYTADHLKGLLSEKIVNQAITKGTFGSLAGMAMHMSQNVNTHTCGTQAGVAGCTVNETTTLGDTALTFTVGSGLSFTRGDIFTIAAVNGVNPITGISTGKLRQFVCNTTKAGTSTALADLAMTPGTAPYQFYDATATKATLPYQNMDLLPVSAAAVTIAGSASLVHPVNLAFHQDAIALCMVPLEMPASVSWGSRMSYKGYQIRVVRDYDVINDLEYIRFDVLYGIKTLNPFLACRIAG
jgi:hypothetical protein